MRYDNDGTYVQLGRHAPSDSMPKRSNVSVKTVKLLARVFAYFLERGPIFWSRVNLSIVSVVVGFLNR